MRAFRAAASHLLHEVGPVIKQVGRLQEIGMRLARIEGVIGGLVTR